MNTLLTLAQNARRYIKDASEAPTGAIVKTGKLGGIYYETSGLEPGAQVEQAEAQKEQGIQRLLHIGHTPSNFDDYREAAAGRYLIIGSDLTLSHTAREHMQDLAEAAGLEWDEYATWDSMDALVRSMTPEQHQELKDEALAAWNSLLEHPEALSLIDNLATYNPQYVHDWLDALSAPEISIPQAAHLLDCLAHLEAAAEVSKKHFVTLPPITKDGRLVSISLLHMSLNGTSTQEARPMEQWTEFEKQNLESFKSAFLSRKLLGIPNDDAKWFRDISSDILHKLVEEEHWRTDNPLAGDVRVYRNVTDGLSWGVNYQSPQEWMRRSEACLKALKQGLNEHKAAGHPIPRAIGLYDLDQSPKAKKQKALHSGQFLDGPNAITINLAAVAWWERTRKSPPGKGDAKKDILGTVYHELGHCAHFAHAPGTYKSLTWGWPYHERVKSGRYNWEEHLHESDQLDYFTEHVSAYACSHPLEFVAEVAYGIQVGHKFPKQVIDYYLDELSGYPYPGIKDAIDPDLPDRQTWLTQKAEPIAQEIRAGMAASNARITAYEALGLTEEAEAQRRRYGFWEQSWEKNLRKGNLQADAIKHTPEALGAEVDRAISLLAMHAMNAVEYQSDLAEADARLKRGEVTADYHKERKASLEAKLKRAQQQKEAHEHIAGTLIGVWKQAFKPDETHFAHAVKNALSHRDDAEANIKQAKEQLANEEAELARVEALGGTPDRSHVEWLERSILANQAQRDAIEKWKVEVQAYHHPSLFTDNARTYIKNPADAPEGASVQRGKRGGLYYESTGVGGDAPSPAVVTEMSFEERVDAYAKAAGLSRDDAEDLLRHVMGRKMKVEARLKPPAVKKPPRVQEGMAPGIKPDAARPRPSPYELALSTRFNRHAPMAPQIQAWLKEVGNDIERRDLKFYAEQGEPMYAEDVDDLPDDIQEAVEKIMQRQPPQQGACYYNAMMSLSMFTGRDDVYYCEGIYADSDLPHPIQHGWLEIGGHVIDPTFIEVKGSQKNENGTYIGVRFKPQTVLEMLVKEEMARPMALGPPRPRHQRRLEDAVFG